MKTYLAHNIGPPHTEPPPQSDGGGGAGAAVIVVVIVVTLAIAGGLIWLRQRMARLEAGEGSVALERDAQAQRDQDRARPALEPRNDPRPGQQSP